MSDILTKIKSTADILGGAVFFADENGVDPENPSVNDLLPNGMYIRLEGSNNNVAYVSAFEIDKAIGIIAQMSMDKANQSDIVLLNQMMGEKVSDTDFEILKNDVSDKASKVDVDNLLDTFENKVDKSVVDEVILQLATKANQTEVNAISDTLATKANQTEVNAISDTLATKANQTEVNAISDTLATKANQTEVNAMLDDIVALQNAVSVLTDTNVIESINAQIEVLKSEIKKRLTTDDLCHLQTSINNLTLLTDIITEKLDNIEVNVNKKATQSYVQGQVSELNNAITSLAAKFNTKADKSEMINKASKETVDNLVAKVSTLNTKLTDIDLENDAKFDEIIETLNKKSNKSDIDKTLSDLSSTVSLKTDKSEFNTEVDRLSKRLNTVDDTLSSAVSDLNVELEEFKGENVSSLFELRTTSNAHSRELEKQSNKIKALEQNDYDIEEQLKMQWVRVMTPEAYNRLAPINSSSNGISNPFAKQPNVVYMLVRYNKPIAIYIGDILIAQAEQDDSTGFAYRFPIVF